MYLLIVFECVLFLEILIFMEIKEFCSSWTFSDFWGNVGKYLCKRANFSLMTWSSLISSFKGSFCNFYLNQKMSNWLHIFCSKVAQSKTVGLKRLRSSSPLFCIFPSFVGTSDSEILKFQENGSLWVGV